jgi:PBP1b-binding outer membrane lipoprotein LpoB
MQTLRRVASVLLLAYALAACSSDDTKPKKDAGSEDDGDSQNEESADAESAPEPDRDAGGPTESDTVPLTVWVDDLVDNHTTDEAEPDTVDDKKISDDTDETSFDKYLP